MTGLAQLYALLKRQNAAETIAPQNYQVPLGQSHQSPADVIRAPARATFRDPMQAGPSTGMAPLVRMYPGMTTPGNIDIMHRPRHVNPDGSISTVRSMSFGDNGREVLVPTVAENGSLMTDQQAIDQFRRTGRHLGQFADVASADRFAGRLHDQQEAMLDIPSSPVDMGPMARRARSGRAPDPTMRMGAAPDLMSLASMYGAKR